MESLFRRRLLHVPSFLFNLSRRKFSASVVRWKGFLVRTFDTNRLQPSDFLDLSSTAEPSISVDGTPVVLTYGFRLGDSKDILEGRRYIPIPFPENTKGFLYYLPGTTLNPSAGQIRFRLTSKDKPEGSDTPRDLFKPDGMPWNIPIWRAVKSTRMESIAISLIDDGLITAKQSVRIRDVIPADMLAKSSHRVLYSLGQTFPIVYRGMNKAQAWMVGEDSVKWQWLWVSMNSKVDSSSPRDPRKSLFAHVLFDLDAGKDAFVVHTVRMWDPQLKKLSDGEKPMIFPRSKVEHQSLAETCARLRRDEGLLARQEMDLMQLRRLADPEI